MKLWPLPGCAEAATLKAHERDVRGVAFSPDGRRLAIAREWNSFQIWKRREAE